MQAPEPAPGSPGFDEADRLAGDADTPDWNDLTFSQQLGVLLRRFEEEGNQRGAAIGADSAVRRLQFTQGLQHRKDAWERLNVTEEQYLLRNRSVASDLAMAVSRLAEAQRNLDRLPVSNALRKFLEAPTASDAGRLLREKPWEIAKALGVENLPALAVGLVTSAALGPLAGGLAPTAQSSLEGYANGLVGALVAEGIDVTDPEEITEALQDKELMDRVRGKARTESAVQLGTTIASMLAGGPGKRGLRI